MMAVKIIISLSIVIGLSGLVHANEQDKLTIVYNPKAVSECKPLMDKNDLLLAEIVALKAEKDRQANIITVKNAALDKAVMALQGYAAKADMSGAAEYIDPVLGRINVLLGESETRVELQESAEQKADMRFIGAVIEKMKTPNGTIIYQLATNKLVINK